jgi:hypothetical protein
MDIREKYIDFMLDNIIGTNMKVQLPSPQEDGRIFYVKLGPTVFMNVEFEVIEKYTRSVKFKFKFDKYEVEKIIFIPIESAPMSIMEKLNNTLEKLVYNTFVEDGRRDAIKQMYDDKRNYINSQLKTVVGKIKELDEYGDLYKNYQSKFSFYKRMQSSVSSVSGDEWKILTKDEFIEKLKTDDEFNKKWGKISPGVEVDVYGDLYKRYLVHTIEGVKNGFDKIKGYLDNCLVEFDGSYEHFSNPSFQYGYRPHTQEEFIEKLNTDEEFNKKWGGMRKNIVE